jgi:phosphatidate phosphatase APP1
LPHHLLLQLAKQFPNQIAHIFIRDVHKNNQTERFRQAFKNGAEAKWTTFKTAENIQEIQQRFEFLDFL